MAGRPQVNKFAVGAILLIFLWAVWPTGNDDERPKFDPNTPGRQCVALQMRNDVQHAYRDGPGDDEDGTCHSGIPKPIPSLRVRADLGKVLEEEKMEYAAELGVQRGGFSRIILEQWKSMKHHTLVDLWAPQANYKDGSNVNQGTQNSYYDETRTVLLPWVKKTCYCKNFTTTCAQLYPDGFFDFIYVDARHDRKGVLEDLETWWPKLRCGGIMAGHDYIEQFESKGGDWTLNFDGTRDESGRVVKGAVDDFFMGPLSKGHRRQVSACYHEPQYNTWYVRK